MNKLNVIAGKDLILSDHQECIELLEEVLERMKTGDLQDINRVLITMTAHDHTTFTHDVEYHGRALETLGLLKITEASLLNDILPDG